MFEEKKNETETIKWLDVIRWWYKKTTFTMSVWWCVCLSVVIQVNHKQFSQILLRLKCNRNRLRRENFGTLESKQGVCDSWIVSNTIRNIHINLWNIYNNRWSLLQTYCPFRDLTRQFSVVNKCRRQVDSGELGTETQFIVYYIGLVYDTSISHMSFGE